MAVQQIEERWHGDRSVHGHHLVHTVGEPSGVKARRHLVLAVLHDSGRIDSVPDCEPDDRRRQRVVHQTIEGAIITNPFGARTPDLARDVRLRIHGADASAKLIPEAWRGDFVGHIETPTIDAPFDPIRTNAPQEFPDGLGFGVERRQRV